LEGAFRIICLPSGFQQSESRTNLYDSCLQQTAVQSVPVGVSGVPVNSNDKFDPHIVKVANNLINFHLLLLLIIPICKIVTNKFL